jgi:SAM-dependent methyltransferase
VLEDMKDNPNGQADYSSRVPPCPACGSVACKSLGPLALGQRFAGRDLVEEITGGFLWRCPQCTLQFRYPRLSIAELGVLYRQGVPDFWDASPEDRSEWVMAAQWISEQAREKDADRPSTGFRVLDVGCSTGQFLTDVLGPGPRLYGIEINEPAAARAAAKGVTILAGQLEELVATPSDVRFDAITAFDVIEHVMEPLTFLRSLSSHLSKGGRILISTGNTAALSWRVSGPNYWYCGLPEHMVFANPRWFEWAAARCGMTVTRIAPFAHQPRSTLRQRGHQAALGLAYGLFPELYNRMRQRRHGDDATAAARTQPPSWTTATDHILVELTKTTRTDERSA